MLPVPVGDCRVLVHIFDDLAPANSGVVSTEGNLSLLSGIGNDAHFCSTEVVIKQILEPHACNEQEIPWILAAFHDVVQSAVPFDITVILSRQGEGLIKLLQKINQ